MSKLKNIKDLRDDLLSNYNQTKSGEMGAKVERGHFKSYVVTDYILFKKSRLVRIAWKLHKFIEKIKFKIYKFRQKIKI